MAKKAQKTYGPVQFPDHLGLQTWEFQRALDLDLIPPPDAGGRWPADVVAAAHEGLAEIRAAIGTQPDVGQWRAAEMLSERLGVEVTADAVRELARTGAIPVAGEYKGSPLYSGLALEKFNDRAAVTAAAESGKLLMKDAAAAYLRIRLVDLEHLLRAGLLTEAHRVRSGHQRRRAYPAVVLLRRGDLDDLLASPDIDWPTVRSTPKGRQSVLASLPTRQAAATA
jgi:hypothetical protein